MSVQPFPIETESQLPPQGSTYETRSFDMKLHQTSGTEFEKAKDIAAFANANGGVILVGALEATGTGRLLRYEALALEAAKTLREDYDQACRNRCSPVPMIDPRVIQTSSGAVVVVNIWPFPGQVVGVKVRSNKDDGKEKDAWIFPMRSGTHTIDLRPEQTAMLMVPEIRRKACLLSAIPHERRDSIRVSIYRPARSPGYSRDELNGKMVDVNVQANTITLALQDTPKIGGLPKPFVAHCFPLEAVEAVWVDNSSLWNISLGVVLHENHPNWEFRSLVQQQF